MKTIINNWHKLLTDKKPNQAHHLQRHQHIIFLKKTKNSPNQPLCSYALDVVLHKQMSTPEQNSDFWTVSKDFIMKFTEHDILHFSGSDYELNNIKLKAILSEPPFCTFQVLEYIISSKNCTLCWDLRAKIWTPGKRAWTGNCGACTKTSYISWKQWTPVEHAQTSCRWWDSWKQWTPVKYAQRFHSPTTEFMEMTYFCLHG